MTDSTEGRDEMNITEALEEIKQRWQHFFETAKKPARCMFCMGVRVWWNGIRQRSASVWLEGQGVYLPEVHCRRVKCGSPHCGRSWTLRPPGLFPQRHYQLCVVSHAMSIYLLDPRSSQAKVAQGCECSERTVRRWVDWTAQVAEPEDLSRRILEAAREPVLALMRPLADVARKACSRLRQAILSRAGQVLCLLEALGQARGYEPPGLRSVLEAVVAGRWGLSTYRSPSVPEFAWRQWASGWAILVP
jgi:hypothetical protein